MKEVYVRNSTSSHKSEMPFCVVFERVLMFLRLRFRMHKRRRYLKKTLKLKKPTTLTGTREQPFRHFKVKHVDVWFPSCYFNSLWGSFILFPFAETTCV
jgi:hypothetical protein